MWFFIFMFQILSQILNQNLNQPDLDAFYLLTKNIYNEIKSKPQILFDQNIMKIYLELSKLNSTNDSKEIQENIKDDLKSLLVDLGSKQDYIGYKTLKNSLIIFMNQTRIICGPYVNIFNDDKIKIHFLNETKNLQKYLQKEINLEISQANSSLLTIINSLKESKFDDNFQNSIDKLESIYYRLKKNSSVNENILKSNLELYINRLKYNCGNNSNISISNLKEHYYNTDPLLDRKSDSQNDKILGEIIPKDNDSIIENTKNYYFDAWSNNSNLNEPQDKSFYENFIKFHCNAYECLGCCINNTCIENDFSCKIKDNNIYKNSVLAIIFIFVFVSLLNKYKKNIFYLSKLILQKLKNKNNRQYSEVNKLNSSEK